MVDEKEGSTLYDFIQGRLIRYVAGKVVIAACGIGYELYVGKPPTEPLETMVTYYTHFVVREHEQLLYGFPTQAERDMFRRLITISGIGPKVALSLLTHLTPQQMMLAVVEEDSGRLKGVPGIGPKTAKRLILELKDRLKDLWPAYQETSHVAQTHAHSIDATVTAGDKDEHEPPTHRSDDPVFWSLYVGEALQALGFQEEEVSSAIQYIKNKNTSVAEGEEHIPSLEQYLKEALKYLAHAKG